MKFWNNVKLDLNANREFSDASRILIFFSNRGFHAIFIYRLSSLLHRLKVPIIPLILTRLIQIFYSIDIDYKCNILGGVVIVHGVGLVIGEGAVVASGAILFHGVTLGRRGIGKKQKANDGFPNLKENCIVCAGAKLLGNITIGKNSVIGANCVLTDSLAEHSICKLDSTAIKIYQK